MARLFTQADGPQLVLEGERMLKLPNLVYLTRQAENFDVQTAEGYLGGKAGDYVAHDPISGHVWPVTASYVAQHYRPVPPSEDPVPAGA